MNIEKKHLNSVLHAVFNDIKTDREELYSVDGNALFEMRGSSGGVATRLIFYVLDTIVEINKYGRKVKARWAIEIPIDIPLSIKKMQEIVSKEMIEFTKARMENKCKTEDLDGGDFGGGNEWNLKEGQ